MHIGYSELALGKDRQSWILPPIVGLGIYAGLLNLPARITTQEIPLYPLENILLLALYHRVSTGLDDNTTFSPLLGCYLDFVNLHFTSVCYSLVACEIRELPLGPLPPEPNAGSPKSKSPKLWKSGSFFSKFESHRVDTTPWNTRLSSSLSFVRLGTMENGGRFLFFSFLFLFLCLMLCFCSYLFLTNLSHRIRQGSSEKRDIVHFHNAAVIRPTDLFELPVVVCAVRQNTLLGKYQFGSSLRWQYFLVGSRSGCQPWNPQISAGNGCVPTRNIPTLLGFHRWKNFGGKIGGSW